MPKVKAAIAEKAPVVQHKVDEAVTKSKAVYAEKAPPAVQHKVDQAVEKGKAVYAEKAPVVQQQVNKEIRKNVKTATLPVATRIPGVPKNCGRMTRKMGIQVLKAMAVAKASNAASPEPKAMS